MSNITSKTTSMKRDVDIYLSGILKLWLHIFGVHIDRNQIYDVLVSHPYYPSMLAVSNVLSSEFNLTNHSFDFDEDDNQKLLFCKNVTTPFLATLKKNKQYVLVSKISESEVEYQYNRTKIVVTLSQFISIWNGYAMIAIPSPQFSTKKAKGNPDINKIVKYIVLFFWPVALILIASNSYRFITGSIIYIFLLNILGLTISFFLLKKEYDDSASIVDRLCNISGSGCSKAKQNKLLWGQVSWAELGVVYFSGSLLLLLLKNQTNESLLLLYVMSVSTIVFSIYSLYYQFFKLKNICIACMTTLFIFYLSFFAIKSLEINFNNIGYIEIVYSLFVFSVPFGIWWLIKPFVKEIYNNKSLKRELVRFKFKSNYYYYSKKKFTDKSLQYVGVSVYRTGDLNKVIIITNPNCSLCEKVFQDLLIMVEQKISNTTFDIVFGMGDLDQDSENYPVMKILASVYLEKGSAAMLESLKVWYSSNKSVSEFQKLFPCNTDINDINYFLHKHSEWCSENEILGTPTIIYNGDTISSYYDLIDLKYFFRHST